MRIVVGSKHEHGAHGVVCFGGELHPFIVARLSRPAPGSRPADTIGTVQTEVNSGLEGVLAAETTISLVDGQAGRLLYRGYEIGDLAAHGSYDRVVGLLLDGEWPAGDECCRLAELSSTVLP